MDTKKLFSFSIAVLLLSACQKDKEVTKPVKFTSTTYQTLGTYDDTGKPNYMVGRDQISSGLMAFVAQNLPDKDLRLTNPDLLTNKAIGDIDITQASDVYITFVSQGSVSLKNTLGFYTYPTNSAPGSAKDIKTITYIFPQSGVGTPLTPGDKVKIGKFSPGTSIGFVLMKDAWDATTKKLKTDVVHFCSNDVLNPEVDPNLKKHAVLINFTPENKVLIGFEDTDRTEVICDHDFNDLVIYATVTP